MTTGAQNSASEALPLTVLVPETVADPVVIYESHAALRVTILERDGVNRLTPDYDAPGSYILLDLPEADGTWSCYVGKAPGGLRSRMMSHVRNKDHWRRAVLIQKDTTFGFNSAQVAWLEGRLYDLLDAAEDAHLHNGNRPSDETLPPFERTVLEASVLPIRRILRLIGYDPATADDTGTVASVTRARKTSRFQGITLKHVIDAGHLSAGSPVISTNAAWPATGVVNADGTLTVNGTSHPTPSAAATTVKGGAANGWEFWAIQDAGGKTTLATLRARYVDATTQPAPGPSTPTVGAPQ